MKENRRQAGAQWETEAADYLSRKGYRILARNFRSRSGEIDLVLQVNEVLVFVEVKARRSQRYGRPAEAVTPAKLRNIHQTAQFYMTRYGKHHMEARIDVVEVFDTENGLHFEHLVNVTG